MRDYIEINKGLIPYQFNILLGDQWFELYINHNKTADLFTVSLYKEDELICTEPLVFGLPLFKDIYQPEKFPSITLVPYGANETDINYNNLGETVFLTVDDEGESEDTTSSFALAVASGSSGNYLPEVGTYAVDGVHLIDRVTGDKYTVYVENSKLKMQESEG